MTVSLQHSPRYDLLCGLMTVRLHFVTPVKTLLTVTKPLVDTYCQQAPGAQRWDRTRISQCHTWKLYCPIQNTRFSSLLIIGFSRESEPVDYVQTFYHEGLAHMLRLSRAVICRPEAAEAPMRSSSRVRARTLGWQVGGPLAQLRFPSTWVPASPRGPGEAPLLLGRPANVSLT